MILQEYFNRLVHASPVKYYVSGIDGARVTWPWRMNRAKSDAFRRAYVDASQHHILDSNFKDETVGNRDVLDLAYEYECDGAVLADVYQDADATIPALIEGIELYREHSFNGLLVLPLQDPYIKCYDAVKPHTNGIKVWWAIGGLKDADARVKVERTREFRGHVGSGEHIHGLGFGVTDMLARAVRRDADLLDSIDNSTAVSNTVSGLTGDEQTTVTAARALAKRLEFLRELTHYAAEPDDPAQVREPGQMGFDDITVPVADGCGFTPDAEGRTAGGRRE